MKTSQRISVLVVEDSALMRILLADILKCDPNIILVGTANNGKEGVEKAKLLHPDVIISDMIMPQYDGLFLVEQVMKEIPTAVILLSSLDKNNALIFDALKAGAFDFLDKPKEDISNSIKAKNYPLIDLVKEASAYDVTKNAKFEKVKRNTFAHTFDKLNFSALVVGASTGGPGAIESLLKQLPANLAIPVIIAQHMPQSFIDSFAKRLNALSPLEVVVPVKGEDIVPGKVYLAPGTGNLVLKKNPINGSIFFGFSDKTFKEFNNPSIDCLMLSAAKVFGEKVIGVVLTGMGKDGSEGLQSIKKAGGITIAQDEKTSIVFGMPKNAVAVGATNTLVPIQQMGGYIISCF